MQEQLTKPELPYLDSKISQQSNNKVIVQQGHSLHSLSLFKVKQNLQFKAYQQQILLELTRRENLQLLSMKKQVSQKISSKKDTQANLHSNSEENRNLSGFLAQRIGACVQAYSRTKYVSVGCFMIYSLQLLSTVFSKNFAEHFEDNTNYSLVYYLNLSLHYSKIYPVLLMAYSDYNQQVISMIFFAILNGILITYELISLVIWFMRDLEKFPSQSSEWNQPKQKINIQQQILRVVQWYVSIVSQIFSYVAWIPSIEVSCNLLLTDSGASTFTKIACTYVVLSSTLLCLQSRFFDTNYSFLESSDFLAQRKNKHKYICLAADLFIQIIQSVNSVLLSGVSHLTMSILRGFFLIHGVPFFLNNQAQRFTLFQTIYYFLASLSSIICASTGLEQQKRIVLLYFMISMWIPLSFKLSQITLVNKKPNISSFLNGSYTQSDCPPAIFFMHFIYDLRSILNLSIEDYIHNNQGIYLESLFTNHVNFCMRKEQEQDMSLRQPCFCWKYRKDPTKLTIAEINGTTYRNTFLIEYMSASFSLFFRIASKSDRENIEIQICYVMFLIEIAKTPAKAYAQLLELKILMRQTERNSLWKQCDMNLIIERIKKEFTNFFKVSALQNQRLNLPLIFEYEGTSKELKIQMKHGLQLREQFFQFLCNDNIQLETLVEYGNSCLESKKLIEHNIQLLFDIHPYHPSTLYLAQIFVEFFDFRKRKLSQFQSRSKQFFKKRLLKSDGKISLFRQDSCAIFVSLSDMHLEIIRASSSATDFFRCAQSTNVLNKPLSVFFPEWAYDKFAELVRVIEGEGNMHLIKLGEYFTFLRDSQQKVFPVTIRASLGVLSQEEFGLSLFIQKSEKSSLYMICNSGFQIISMTPSVPSFLKGALNNSLKSLSNNGNNGYKNQLDTKDRKPVNVRWLIPHLFSIASSEIHEINSVSGFDDMQGFRELAFTSSREFNSLLMYPKDNGKWQGNKNSGSNVNINDIEQNYDNPYDIEKYFEKLKYPNYKYDSISYSIFKISGVQSSDTDVLVLEISRMKQIERIQEINELLFLLQTSLKERFPKFNIKISSLDKNSKRINQSTEGKIKSIASEMQMETDMTTTRELEEGEEGEAQLEGDYSRQIIESEWVKDTEIEVNGNAGNLVILHSENLKDDAERNDKFNTEEVDDPQNLAYDLISPRIQNKVNSNENPLMSEGPLLNYQSNNNNLMLSDHELKEKATSATISKIDLKLISKKDKISNVKFPDTLSSSRLQLQKLSSTTLQTTDRQTQIQFNWSVETDRQLINQHRQNEQNNQDNHYATKSNSLSKKNPKDIASSKKVPKILEASNLSSEQSDSQGAKKQKNFADDSSINSAQSQFFSKKQSLYDMVVKRKKIKEVVYSRIVGFASLVIILSVTVYLYFVLNSQFQTEKRYYTNLLFGPDLLESFASVMRIMEIKMIIQLGTAYGFLASHFTAADVKNYGLEGSSKLVYLDGLLGGFQQTMINNGLSEFMLQNYTTIYIRDISGLIKIPTEFTRFYSLINVPINMFGYMIFGTKQWRTYIYTNYQSFVSTFSVIQEIQLAGAYSQLNDSKNLIIYSFIIYEISCLCSVILILPLYYLIQTKREEILKLIVTFSPSFLELMINRHHEAQQMDIFETSVDILGTEKRLAAVPTVQIRSKGDFKALKLVQQGQQQQQQYKSNQQQNQFQKSKRIYQVAAKKRQVSTVNRLSRSSLKMILMVCGVFIVISLYTLLNYVFTADFFNYFEYNISEISLITRTKAQLDIDLVSMYLEMNCQPYNFSKSEILDLLNFHATQILPDFVSRIQEFYYLQQNFDGKDRSFLSNYQQVLNEAINGNACNLLNSTYTSQIDGLEIKLSDVTIPTIDCQTIQNGALTKGLVFWLKLFQTKFTTSNQVFIDNFGKPLTTYFYGIYKWDAENSLRNVEMVYSHVRNILNTLANFMSKRSTDFIENLLFTQLILFCYSIIVSSIILLYIWHRYVQWMDQSLFKTTILLSLIPIEYSVDNPYILSYLHKEKSKINSS